MPLHFCGSTTRNKIKGYVTWKKYGVSRRFITYSLYVDIIPKVKQGWFVPLMRTGPAWPQKLATTHLTVVPTPIFVKTDPKHLKMA